VSVTPKSGGGEDVFLRDVEERDLPVFFEHQREPEANEMAAFSAREWDVFLAHWRHILADESVAKQTIMAGERVAGNIVCFDLKGDHFVGYWLGRDMWGQGIATRALTHFLTLIEHRPLHAWVAAHNVGSIRVLEKCGFELTQRGRSAAPTGGPEVDEFLYRLAN